MLRVVYGLALSLVFCANAAADAFIESLQQGVVQEKAKHWYVKIRVEQDNPERPEAGLAARMAGSIAARKLLEFGCGIVPAAGEKISGKVAGLLTVSSVSNAEWAEVVLSAPVQKLTCKSANGVPTQKSGQSIRVFPLD